MSRLAAYPESSLCARALVVIACGLTKLKRDRSLSDCVARLWVSCDEASSLSEPPYLFLCVSAMVWHSRQVPSDRLNEVSR